MRSRVVTGFHRLGVVLALPIVGAALWLAAVEWQNPTGKPQALPHEEGLLAWRPEKADSVVEALIREQTLADVDAPPGFLVVGKKVKTERKGEPGGNIFNDLVLGAD